MYKILSIRLYKNEKSYRSVGKTWAYLIYSSEKLYETISLFNSTPSIRSMKQN